MNKTFVWKKLLLPSVLIGLFFIALAPSLTFAQNSKSTNNDLARAIYMRDYANNAELNQVADQIFLEKITPEFTAMLYATLYDFQRDIVTKKLAELTGASFSELQKEQKQSTIEGDFRSPGYNVQMPYGVGTPRVTISSYTSNYLCDSDSTDDDWVFFANTPQTVSPSQMRWDSTSSLVTWAFNTAYNGMLSTYGYHGYQINICLGTNGVLLAGGVNNVKDSLRIKYR